MENEPIRFPKVLIISETFKSTSGGGITLSNLFRDWPKDRLANAIDSKMVDDIESDEICNNFYRLGIREKKTLRFFSFLQKKYQSGPYHIVSAVETANQLNKGTSVSVRTKLINYFFRFLRFIGIYQMLYKYELSEELTAWIKDFNPDYIYTQLSNRELIHFTNDLIELTNARLAIHIMDDWPATIGKEGLMGNYWHKKISTEFKELLDKATVLMSISEGMSMEYFKRYQHEFIAFHNPIDVNHWTQFSKKNTDINTQNVNVLYAGRIGLGTSFSVIEIAEAIEELNKEGQHISFQIQTTSVSPEVKTSLQSFRCVSFNPVIEYNKLPAVFSSADLLVLPIDFDKKGIDFLRYSMPTKVSEYMVSATPILLYCSKEVSLYNHAKKYGWAYICAEKDIAMLKSSLMKLIYDADSRKVISKTAFEYAVSTYDANLVRNKFRKMFD